MQKIKLLIITFFLFTFPNICFGKGIIPESEEKNDLGDKIKNGTIALSDLPEFIIYLIDLATKIAGTIAVGFLIYGGFLFILSGLTEKKEEAKNTIKYSFIGLIITFLAWLIVNFIQMLFTS